jgi:hypothetical protein
MDTTPVHADALPSAQMGNFYIFFSRMCRRACVRADAIPICTDVKNNFYFFILKKKIPRPRGREWHLRGQGR